MKRVFHPYWKCEEYAAGMWRTVPEQERHGFTRAAADLMRDPEAFYQAMLRAVREWRFSCEHNLTARQVNKRAWLGHAGCLLATGSPEDLTRLGWHTLTTPEQDAANAAADRAIAAWESLYIHLRANPNAAAYGGHHGNGQGQEGERQQEEDRAAGAAVLSAGLSATRREGLDVADLRGASEGDS